MPSLVNEHLAASTWVLPTVYLPSQTPTLGLSLNNPSPNPNSDPEPAPKSKP